MCLPNDKFSSKMMRPSKKILFTMSLITFGGFPVNLIFADDAFRDAFELRVLYRIHDVPRISKRPLAMQCFVSGKIQTQRPAQKIGMFLSYVRRIVSVISVHSIRPLYYGSPIWRADSPMADCLRC